MLLSADLEAYLIAPGLQAPPPVAIGFTVDDSAPEIIGAHDPAFRRLVEWFLTDPTVLSTWHNSAFDLSVLCTLGQDFTDLVFDAADADRVVCTRIREKLIRIADGTDRSCTYDLAASLKRHTGADLDKSDPWRLKYGTLYGIDPAAWPPEAVRYLHLDATAQRDLHRAQESAGPEVLADQYRQTRAALWLRLAECWGVVTDPKAVGTYRDQVREGLRKAEALARSAGLIRPNGTKDTKAATARMVQACPDGKTTATGKPSLDYEACESSGDPVLVAYSEFSQAGTLLAKVERLAKPLIQASYDPLKATGRTSCRQGEDPKPGQAATAHGAQLQNPPQAAGVRECIVAREGSALVSIDYDACEMRTWAQVCLWSVGHSKLAEVLNDPARDPHVEMGAGLRGIPVAEAYALKGAARKDLRGMAKGPNFGLPGGMGWASLIDYCRQGYGVTLSEAEARHACQVWRETWPEAQPYLDWVGRLTEGHRFHTIRQFVSGRVRGGVGFCDTANGFFQGLAADIAKAAGWRIARECYTDRRSPLYGCRIVIFVHDEFILEVPLDRLTEAGNRAAAIMIQTAQEWSPDLRYSASPAAMLRWSKAAGDPVYDSAGNLIPWEWRATG